MTRFAIIITVMAFAGLFMACEQQDAINNETIEDVYLEAVNDDSYSEELVNTLVDDVDYELSIADADGYSATTLKSGSFEGRSCRPEVTIHYPDSTQFPKVITLYFDGECENQHGKVREGTIIITLSDRMWNEGAIRTMTFDEFYIDSCKIEGTRTFTNIGQNEDGLWQQSISLVDGKIIFPDGSEISHEAEKIKTWIELPARGKGWMGSYTIEGGASGVNLDGVAYNMEIVTPLFKEMFCPWFVSGVKNITVDDVVTSVDFGDGTCDNIIEVTVDGVTTEKTIERRRKHIK